MVTRVQGVRRQLRQRLEDLVPTYNWQSITQQVRVPLIRDGRPVPRGTLPAGKGGFPAPPRPVKMIKTAGKLQGKIKARISTFSNRRNQ